jgi:SNF2 family DNA or RNA helicase
MLEKERDGTEVPKKDGKGTVIVRGGFQCDDMGLGKTIQMVGTMINHCQRSTLLMAPLAMIRTWSEICMKAGMLVYEIQDGAWVRMNVSKAFPQHFMKCRPAVYITNYEKLYHKSYLMQRAWDRIVLDEAHKIRNGDGELARRIRKIEAPIRWAITGTPLVNSKKDVVSLLAFIGVPYSVLWTWEKRYESILPQLLLHRSLDSLRDTIQGAPPIPTMQCDILPFRTAQEDEFYHGVQGTSHALLEKYSHDLLSPNQSFLLLLRLRQISVHPQVYINAKRREDPHYSRADWSLPSTKMERIRDIIVSDNQSVHKYIIFCQFHDEMALIHDFLSKEKLIEEDHILSYHGGMNQAARDAVLQRSKKTTQSTVLLLQLQAGGVGLNLQEYDRIIFVSPWWTAALMDQAIARAVRIGQTKVVKIYHLRLDAEADSTINIDELVSEKAEEKRKMLEWLFELCM